MWVVQGGERRDPKYTDGSRYNGRTAAATMTEFQYLGEYATVMDAEMLAISMGWRLGRTVATDSQAAIARIMELQHSGPKSWIEEEVIKETGAGRKELLWVPGHAGILGNEMADYKAKQGVHMGMAMGEKNRATPGGIKQHFRMTEEEAGERMGPRRNEWVHLHLYR